MQVAHKFSLYLNVLIAYKDVGKRRKHGCGSFEKKSSFSGLKCVFLDWCLQGCRY